MIIRVFFKALTYPGAVRFLTLALIALTLMFVTFPAWSKSPEQIFELVSPSIVVVEVYDARGRPKGMGSGVVIARGEVVTNYHVVQRGSIYKVSQGDATYTAQIRYSDAKRDLCQLNVPDLRAPPVKMASMGSVKTGERVVAIGAPRGLELTISEGLVSALRDFGDGSKYIQTTAPISPGSSGGGLFDENGLLIGITTFYLEQGQNLNFAAPVDWIPGLRDQQARTAAKPAPAPMNEDDRLLQELAELVARLRTTDPEFDAKYQYLRPILEEIIESGVPRHRWAQEFERAYWALDIGASAEYLEQAQELFEAEEWSGLAELGERWVRAAPDYALAWVYAGVGRNQLNEQYLSAAEDLYARAATSDNRDLKEEMLRRRDEQRALARQENRKAIYSFKQAVQLSPDFAFAWLFLGAAYLLDNDLIGASNALSRLETLDTEMAESLAEEIRDR